MEWLIKKRYTYKIRDTNTDIILFDSCLVKHSRPVRGKDKAIKKAKKWAKDNNLTNEFGHLVAGYSIDVVGVETESRNY